MRLACFGALGYTRLQDYDNVGLTILGQPKRGIFAADSITKQNTTSTYLTGGINAEARTAVRGGFSRSKPVP